MREFTVVAGNVGPFTCQTAIFINPSAAPNVNLELLRFWAGQYANATSAQQRVQLVTQVSTFPNSLTSFTPAKLKVADPNASVIIGSTAGTAGTAGINSTTIVENGGAKTSYWEDAFNVLNGWLHVPTPAETKVMPASFASGLGMVFPGIASGGSASNWQFGLVFREV